jgi:multidrug transporter EmrE-like cation transporter
MAVSASTLKPETQKQDPAASRPRPKGLLNPYFQILLGALFATASEVFLKKGAAQTVAAVGYPEWLSISAFGSGLVWLAILCYCSSFATWLHVLRHVPLNIAFNLSSIVHVFVPLACWLFLGEDISEMRWFGISLVLLGIGVIAKPLVSIEEKL